jgi:hypothetical protein
MGRLSIDRARSIAEKELNTRYKRQDFDNNLNSRGFRGGAVMQLQRTRPELELIGNPIPSKYTDVCLYKFRQKYNGIPIYNSHIILEVSEKGEDLYLNPSEVDKIDLEGVSSVPQLTGDIPKLIQEDLRSHIQEKVGYSLEGIELDPAKYYYYDELAKKWRLVYITSQKFIEQKEYSKPISLPEFVDYIVDAQSGELIGKISRIRVTLFIN